MISSSTSYSFRLWWRLGSLALLALLTAFVFYRSPALPNGALFLRAGAELELKPSTGSSMTVRPSSAVASSVQSPTARTPQLFYPAVYNGYNDGVRTWNSILTVQNSSTTNSTSVQMVFYHPNGQLIIPISLPTTGNSLQNPFTLAAGASATIRVDPQSNIGLQQGSQYAVVVSSDLPLVGVNWVKATGAGESHGAYAGFAPTTATTVYVPSVAKAANGFTSNLALQNLSNAALNGVTLNFYDQNGNQVGQLNAPPIAANAAWYPNLTQSQLPNGFSGSLVVTSPNGPLAVVDNKIGGANGLTLLTYSGASMGAQTLYAPFLSTQTGNSATLTIQNTSNNQAANVTVTNSDGIGNSQVQIPPRSSRTISYNAGSHNAQFVATITANQAVVAVITIQTSSGGGYAYEAFEQGATTYTLSLLMKQYQNAGSSATFNTSTLLFNPGGSPAQVQFRYNTSLMRQETVNPGQFLTIATNNEGNLPSGYVGSAIFSSSQPLFAAVGVSGQGATGDLFAFYRGIAPPVPAVTMAKTASVPYLKPGDPLTYTLSFAAGASGGPAVIADFIPSQLLNHTYSVGGGVAVTPTGAVDYQWDVAVPAAGGIIQIGGIVDPAIVTDTLLVNTAVITANNSSASSTKNVIVDVSPPNTIIIDKPSDPSSNATPTFQFSATDGAGSGLASFECQVDGAGWNSCSANFTTGSLADGLHTVEARAIDHVGLVDATPASYTWTVDLIPPAIPVLVSPVVGSTITDTQSVTLIWSAVAAADLAGYKVNFDGVVANVNNTTNYGVGPLANGVYTWTVAAYDTVSNTSAFAGVISFTLSADAPQVLTISPPGNSHTAAVNASVMITLSKPINVSTVTTHTFAIHAMQSGQRLQAYSTNGATITFTPNQPFKPGELVQVSASSGLQSSNGFALLPPIVWQFRARTSGGVGQFVTGSSFGLNHAHEGLLGDVDGDGDLDFVVAGYGTISKLYLNDGDGTFDTTAYDIGSTDLSVALALGDGDGDGDLDLALSQDNDQDRIYWNDGVGNPFDTTALDLDANFLNAKDFAFGDVDGDGDLDLILCHTIHLSVYTNNGAAGFGTAAQMVVQRNCERLAVGDINRDGTLDFVLGNGSDIVIYLNQGSSSFLDDTTYTLSGQVSAEAHDLLLGDLDGDGDLDLIVNDQDHLNHTNMIYLNDGNGNPYDTAPKTIVPTSGTRSQNLALGDVDGDGDLDIITGNWSVNGGGAQDLLYLNDGNGNFPTTSDLGPGGFNNMTGGLDVGDLDGDGDLDIAAAMTNNFPQLSYLNANEPLPATPTPTPTNTPEPGTSTATPTPTNTSAPPTATTMPGTLTPTPTPTNTPVPGTPTPTPTLPASDATTVAEPGQPATLTYSDPGGGGVAVQIPAGAVDQATTFLYDDQGTPSQPGAFQFAGRTFTLTAYRNNSALNDFAFQQPVTLVIDYTDADVAGVDENALTLFFYDVDSGSWSEQGITVLARDPVNNRITIQITHLTEFAMGAANRLYLPVVARQ